MNEAMDMLSARVERMDQLIDPSDPSTFRTALQQLNEIVHELEQLKRIETNSMASNVGNPKMVHIINEITEMLNFTNNLKMQLEGAVSEYENKKRRNEASGGVPLSSTSSNSSSSASASSSFTSTSTSQPSQEPLTRQEIAKLLLLVSKAYQMNVLTSKQRSNLKNQIIMRSAYLRLIVQNSDIRIIMGALAVISKETP
jgi:hypothetical protein